MPVLYLHLSESKEIHPWTRNKRRQWLSKEIITSSVCSYQTHSKTTGINWWARDERANNNHSVCPQGIQQCSWGHCADNHMSLFHSEWQNVSSKNNKKTRMCSGPCVSCRLTFLYELSSCQPLITKAIGYWRALFPCRSQWLSSTVSSNHHNKECLSARFSSQRKYRFLWHPPSFFWRKRAPSPT